MVSDESRMLEKKIEDTAKKKIETDVKAEEVHAEEEESGERKTVKMQDPAMPSESERREHELTHLPFRSWCRHCVRGRGREASHRRSEEKPEGARSTWTCASPARRTVPRT